jgi:DNA-binding CsgD family transcriptional regulator
MDRSATAAPTRRRAATLALLVALQAVAAAFFLADAVSDAVGPADGSRIHILAEMAAVAALLIGVLFGALAVRRTLADASRAETAAALARGALAEMMRERFSAWRLTAAEGDVALFLLKGLDIADIARLRGVAPGTVRAQLTSIYAKAGVSSQAQLTSLFLDALIDLPADRQAGGIR